MACSRVHNKLAMNRYPSGIRKWPRMKLEIPLQVRKNGDWVRGWCQSMSVRGMGATLAGDFAVGDRVELQFRLPDLEREDVTVSAFVIWKIGLSHGFEFLTLPNSCRQAIEVVAQEDSIAEPGPEFGKAY